MLEASNETGRSTRSWTQRPGRRHAPSAGAPRHDWTVDAGRSPSTTCRCSSLIDRARAVHRACHGEHAGAALHPAQRQDRRLPRGLRATARSRRHYETDVGPGDDARRRRRCSPPRERAREAARRAFCMGAAWREVKDGPAFERVLDMVRGVKALGLEACCTLGMLTDDQARRLKEAGLDAYNHNLDTSRKAYSSIIIDAHVRRAPRDACERRGEAGITVCSGGIIGMGESIDDRCAMLVELAEPRSAPGERADQRPRARRRGRRSRRCRRSIRWSSCA